LTVYLIDLQELFICIPRVIRLFHTYSSQQSLLPGGASRRSSNLLVVIAS
jgi:hypothetical protein